MVIFTEKMSKRKGHKFACVRYARVAEFSQHVLAVSKRCAKAPI